MQHSNEHKQSKILVEGMMYGGFPRIANTKQEPLNELNVYSPLTTSYINPAEEEQRAYGEHTPASERALRRGDLLTHMRAAQIHPDSTMEEMDAIERVLMDARQDGDGKMASGDHARIALKAVERLRDNKGFDKIVKHLVSQHMPYSAAREVANTPAKFGEVNAPSLSDDDWVTINNRVEREIGRTKAGSDVSSFAADVGKRAYKTFRPPSESWGLIKRIRDAREMQDIVGKSAVRTADRIVRDIR
jgi:hypothetical protein